MNTKARLKKLEKETSRYTKTVKHVGLKGDPQSQLDYEEYLRSGSGKPFIWLDAGPDETTHQVDGRQPIPPETAHSAGTASAVRRVLDAGEEQ